MASDEPTREALRRRILDILEDDDTKRDLRATVHEAYGDYIRRALPWFKGVVTVALLLGLSAGGVALYVGSFFAAQRARVQESVRQIALIPELLLHTAGTVQNFRRQQAEFTASTNSKRWELQDRIDEFSVLEAGLARRLTRLLDLYIAGELSQRDLGLQTKAALEVAKALGAVSDITEFQDARYKQIAPPLFQRAMIADEDSQFSAANIFLSTRMSFAEPRLKYAALLITEFSDATAATDDGHSSPHSRLGLLRHAREKLEQARDILRGDRYAFYADRGYGDYLAAEVEYQAALADYYFALHCKPTALECDRKDPSFYWDRAIESLKRAQAHYMEWRRANGTSPDANPRYTATTAMIYYNRQDLRLSEAFSKQAIEQARARGTEYWLPLNALAWVYSQGFAKYDDFKQKEDKDYYSRARSQAIGHAYRALRLVPGGTEHEAEALLTLAAVLKNFGANYATVLAEYKSLATLKRLVDRSGTVQERGVFEAKVLDVCRRVFDDAQKALAAGFSPKQRDFYEGRVHQVRALVTGPNFACPATKTLGDLEKNDLTQARKNFSQAIQTATARNSYTLKSELGLAVTDTALSERFPELIRERVGDTAPSAATAPAKEKRPGTIRDPLNVLDRLEGDASFLREHFIVGSGVRVVMSNNLVWSTLLTEGKYSDLDADDLAGFALEASADSHWENQNVLGTLAAALLAKGIRTKERGISDTGSFERARAVVLDLSLQLQNAKDSSLKQTVEKLNACLGRALSSKELNCKVSELMTSRLGAR